MNKARLNDLKQRWSYDPELARATPNMAVRLTVKQRMYIAVLAAEVPDVADELFRVVTDIEGDIDHLTVGGAMWVINQLLSARRARRSE